MDMKREYLFHGKSKETGEWVEGYYVKAEKLDKSGYEHFIIEEGVDGFSHLVYPESIGMYTGMNEFVVTDRSFNKPLFKGDIVEVWSTRRPYYTNPKSQYDGDIKVRAVIRFIHGAWSLDYNNNYNKSLTKLKGKEVDDRTVDGWSELYYFGCHSNEEWEREHNIHYKWSDIVKLGTVFENADLLEG